MGSYAWSEFEASGVKVRDGDLESDAALISFRQKLVLVNRGLTNCELRSLRRNLRKIFDNPPAGLEELTVDREVLKDRG